MNKRLYMPDGLRVIAIGLVMWFHIWQQSWLSPVFDIGIAQLDMTAPVRTGYIMVDIMLMLSGYLLFIPIARGGKLDVLPFYRKRLARIIPSYLLSVLVMLIAFALPANDWHMTGALWKDLISHLTFTHTFFYETYVGTALNVVLWTLAIEMQFYLIFPAVCALFRRKPVITYAVMTIVALVCREFAAAQESNDIFINQLPCMLDVYANGMLAAIFTAALEKQEQNKMTRLFHLAISMFAFFAIWRLIQGQYSDSFPLEMRRLGQLKRRFELSALGAVILVCGESSYLLYKGLFSNRISRFLAGISFNAYIWHQVLAVKLKEWKIPNYFSDNPASAGEHAWQLKYTLLCFALSLVLAATLTYLFERPLTKILTQISIKRRCINKKKMAYNRSYSN